MITSRRAFIRSTALTGVSLVIGIDGTSLLKGGQLAAGGGPFKPNIWIRIDPDNSVTVTIGRSEMGQGVRTSLAMLLAEELEADWSRIKLMQASPSRDFTDLGTGGSDSIRDGWKSLRQAGAAAREMLITAAAQRWQVEAASCTAEKGVVLHHSTNRRLNYGELVADAARLPLPATPSLKSPRDYKIIGRPTARIDGRDIVSGKARYGVDVKVAGMLHASLERPPWSGAKAKNMQEDKARAVRGVRNILKLPHGIAVVADSTWAAIKGRTALAVQWENPPADAFDSNSHFKQLEAAAREKGVTTRREDPPPGTKATADIIEAFYRYPFYAHAPVETMNCVADVREDRCTIWAPTQAPNRL